MSTQTRLQASSIHDLLSDTSSLLYIRALRPVTEHAQYSLAGKQNITVDGQELCGLRLPGARVQFRCWLTVNEAVDRNNLKKYQS